MLRLWCRLAAVALILPLVWELSYAAGAALKRKKNISDHVSLQLHTLYGSPNSFRGKNNVLKMSYTPLISWSPSPP